MQGLRVVTLFRPTLKSKS